MNSIKTLFTAILALHLLPANGQQTGIVAGADSAGTQIIVKWFSEQVVFPQGVHVYRREAGRDWVKLTAQPLKKGDIPVPQAVVQSDSTMQAFVDAARSITDSDLKGFIGAMMMVKAVQSNHYARFLGLCYTDGDVTPGVSYRYRVTRVQAGRETPVAETGDITAGKYTPAAPPQGLTVKAGDTGAEIKWTPEPARPLIKKVTRQENALLVEWVPNAEPDLKAYHVYRMNMNDSTVAHLNPAPVSRTVNRFTDLRVKPGITYRYYITATDSANNVSAASEYFYATFVPDEQPATDSPVSSFKMSYKPGQKQVSLRWKLDSRPNIKGTILFRSDGDSFVPVTGLLKVSEYQDRDIAEDRSYTYRLHVFLTTGEVFKSEEIKVEVKK